MTLLKITQLGHPILLQRAREIEDVDDPAMLDLGHSMVETMLDAGGVGLAAPQVYRDLRMIAVLPIARRGDTEEVEPLVIVNPVLEPIGEELVSELEGCLSIPGLRGKVPRHRHVGYSGLDLEGRPIAGEAKDFFARVLQHEVDHLDGILFLMRMTDLRSLSTLGELHHQLSDEAPEETT